MPGEDLLAEAFRRQAKNVRYSDYKAGEDFPLWLAGYREKIRNAFGLNNTQDAEVDAEVVRSISGKLQSGTPLDAYSNLSTEVKDDYARLVKSLSDEFLDKQKRRRFRDKKGFNVRKKDQTLKEFSQEIKKAMNQYSGMDDYVGTGANKTLNQAKVQDGILRFVNGIRDRNGNLNKDQQEHLRYNLYKDEDLSWDHALDVAERWEAAHDFESSDSDSSDSSDSDALEAMEEKPKTKEEKRAAKKAAKKAAEKTAKKAAKAGKGSIISAVETTSAVATLTDRVMTNERNIKNVQSEQEKLSANVTAWKNETSSQLNELLGLAKSNQQTLQSQPIQNRFTPNPGFRGANIRPTNFVWKGRVGQSRQTGFGFNRSSPQTVRSAAPATAPANAVAAMEVAAAGIDPAAQSLEQEEVCMVTLPMDQFVELNKAAGQDVDANDLVASLADLNFC